MTELLLAALTICWVTSVLWFFFYSLETRSQIERLESRLARRIQEHSDCANRAYDELNHGQIEASRRIDNIEVELGKDTPAITISEQRRQPDGKCCFKLNLGDSVVTFENLELKKGDADGF